MPPSPQLQKWQKNQIFKAIQSAGLDPQEFSLEELGLEVTKIKHKWSKSYFLFAHEIVGGLYVGHAIIGDGPEGPYQSARSWKTLMARFSRWLRDLKRNLDTPDPVMSPQFKEQARRAFHAVERLDPDNFQVTAAHRAVNDLLDTIKTPTDKEVHMLLFAWLAELELEKSQNAAAKCDEILKQFRWLQ